MKVYRSLGTTFFHSNHNSVIQESAVYKNIPEGEIIKYYFATTLEQKLHLKELRSKLLNDMVVFIVRSSEDELNRSLFMTEMRKIL